MSESSPAPLEISAKSSSRHSRRSRSSRNHLNEINFLNAGYCITSTLINVGVGLCGWFTLPTYAKQSHNYMYSSLISPAPWFIISIWILIYVSEIAFAVFQLTPALRKRAEIQNGIKYFYGLATLFQVLFTMSYCLGMLWASLFCAFGVIFSLRSLIDSEAQVASDHSWAGFWILRFPFQLHLGWMDFVAVLTFNNIMVKMNVDTTAQIVFAVLSAIILLIVTCVELFLNKPWFIIRVNKPLFIIPLVFLYALGGTIYGLYFQSRKRKTYFVYDNTIYPHAYPLFWAGVCALIFMVVFVRWIIYLRRGEYKANEEEAEEEDNTPEESNYVNADELQNEVV